MNARESVVRAVGGRSLPGAGLREATLTERLSAGMGPVSMCFEAREEVRLYFPF